MEVVMALFIRAKSRGARGGKCPVRHIQGAAKQA